jgi:glycosyltransferase involved in cell wall biosynthesis
MSEIRVLHVIPSVSPGDGGPSKAITLMERALGAGGIAVTTLTTDHRSEFERATGASLPLAEGATRVYARKWISAYKVAPGLIAQLGRHLGSHDVVHIHAMFSFAPTVAAWMARRFDVPYIVRPLGTLSTYGMTRRRRRLKQLSLDLVESRILRNAAAVHFTSKSECEEAQSLGLCFRGVVIPLGVEREPAGSAATLRAAYPALVGRRAVLFLSRLDPKKNVSGLIDAMALSDTLKRSATLLIAGNGAQDYIDSLKARAAAAGIADHIIWLGHVEGAQKSAAFAAADVFALPSLSENFGIAAVEAMLAGLPCILGQGVAIATEIALAGAGLAVTPDPQAIAGALEKILGNDDARHQMGQRAFGFAEREYSTGAMAERLIALYDEVCARRRSRPRELPRPDHSSGSHL